jgi:hypothetical protein
MSNTPTAGDIAAVIADVRGGYIFDPAEHDTFWNCNLYKGEHWFGEGQGNSGAEAAAYAWIHAHAEGGLENPEELAAVPPEVDGVDWRFELAPPKPSQN